MNRSILAAGIIVLAVPAQAQQTSVENEEVALDPVIVTVGKAPADAEKTGKAYTVITGEQLEQRQVRYVADALRQVPGFAVSRSGSYGGLTQVRVRGAEANHLLVMIDGVEASETSAGEFDFASLLVSDIDRIEVLRGPQSAFWGSNATAGVVNIITKRGDRTGFKVGARSETGTNGTFLGGVTVSGGHDNYDVALSGTFRRTDGFDISEDDRGPFGGEKDGDRNTTLNGKVTWDVTPDLKLDGTLRFVDRKSELDDQDFLFPRPVPDPGTQGLTIDTLDETATREFLGSIGGTHTSFDGALTQRMRFTGSDTKREYTDELGLDSADTGSRLNGSYQAAYEFETPAFLDAKHVLTGGYEWERETYETLPARWTVPSQLGGRERQSNSFVGEYRGEFLDQYYLTAALRHDLNDEFKDATTYSVSGAWRIPGTSTRLHSSVGTGVTNPTFFEQFGFDPGTFIGNPDLIPEKSLGWDIGIEQRFFGDQLVVDLTYFNQNLTDEIATVFDEDFVATPINREGQSKRQGVELSATLNLTNGLSLNGTYTYTDATEQTVTDGPRLREVRRPEHAGSLGAAYVFYDGRARVFGEAVINGSMEDNEFVNSTSRTRVTLDSYTVVNVGGSFKFNDKLEAFARVENFFDEEYQEVFSYNAPGRTAFVGLKGNF